MHRPENGGSANEIDPVEMQEYEVPALVALMPAIRTQVRFSFIVFETASEIFDRHKTIYAKLGYIDNETRTCYFSYKPFVEGIRRLRILLFQIFEL